MASKGVIYPFCPTSRISQMLTRPGIEDYSLLFFVMLLGVIQLFLVLGYDHGRKSRLV